MVSAIAALGLLVALVPAASAGQPIDIGTLTPVPAATYTCKASGGGGAICNAFTSDAYGPEETGIFCGPGADRFQVLDRGTRTIRSTRWYDKDSRLTTRMRQIDFSDVRFYNPVTGAAIYYHQRNTEIEHFTIPGDLGSAIDDNTGQFSINVPGYGNVAKEAGRVVFGPDGETLMQAGPNDYQDYLGGDTALMDDLCEVLGG